MNVYSRIRPSDPISRTTILTSRSYLGAHFHQVHLPYPYPNPPSPSWPVAVVSAGAAAVVVASPPSPSAELTAVSSTRDGESRVAV